MSQDDLDLYPEQTDEFMDASSIPNFDEDEIDEDEQILAKEEDFPSESGDESDGEKEAIPDSLPVQDDEFICSVCYLVRHNSQLARMDGKKPICKECA